MTPTLALVCALTEDRAATVIGEGDWGSRLNSFDHKRANVLSIHCGELWPEISDCRSDRTVGNCGSIGEVFSEISILVHEIRVVGDIGNLERNIVGNQVTAVLEIFRKSKEEQISISCAIALGLTTNHISS